MIGEKVNSEVTYEELLKDRERLRNALQNMIDLFEPGRIYKFKEISETTSKALKIAIEAMESE